MFVLLLLSLVDLLALHYTHEYYNIFFSMEGIFRAISPSHTKISQWNDLERIGFVTYWNRMVFRKQAVASKG
jgi:hypothetical protein